MIENILWSPCELPGISGVSREGAGVLKPPPRNSEGPPKSCQNSTLPWKLVKSDEFRTPALQDVRKKGSKILKLPPVRNCFTLAMINKLVVIINSLKVPKIKKRLLYEMKFLVPNCSCFQNPWLGGRGLPPRSPFSVLNWICWTTPNKIPGYATARYLCRVLIKLEFSRQIFEKYWDVKFHEYPSIGSRVLACGGDRRTWRSSYLLFVISPTRP